MDANELNYIKIKLVTQFTSTIAPEKKYCYKYRKWQNIVWYRYLCSTVGSFVVIVTGRNRGHAIRIRAAMLQNKRLTLKHKPQNDIPQKLHRLTVVFSSHHSSLLPQYAILYEVTDLEIIRDRKFNQQYIVMKVMWGTVKDCYLYVFKKCNNNFIKNNTNIFKITGLHCFLRSINATFFQFSSVAASPQELRCCRNDTFLLSLILDLRC